MKFSRCNVTCDVDSESDFSLAASRTVCLGPDGTFTVERALKGQESICPLVLLLRTVLVVPWCGVVRTVQLVSD